MGSVSLSTMILWSAHKGGVDRDRPQGQGCQLTQGWKVNSYDPCLLGEAAAPALREESRMTHALTAGPPHPAEHSVPLTK